MGKYILAFIILIHGLIHFMGFAKGFGYGHITQLTKNISRPAGLLWFTTAILFITAPVLFLLKNESWPYIAIVAAILSQILIISVWRDAKFGTIANILVLLVAMAAWGSQNFESQFRKDVKTNLRQTNPGPNDLLTVADIQALPQPVQKYLRYAGVINKPKVKNMRVEMDVQMREKGKDFFSATSVQYNYFNEPTRLFFMKAKMFGITVPGYHYYMQKKAVMDIRLFGLFPMVQIAGAEMNKAETVTLFNDMCLMAPATLIDKRIKWEPIDENKAKAIFTNGNISITAILYFDEQGHLINFTSSDRYDVNGKQWIPFSTPVHEYKNYNGYNLFYKGDAVWHYREGEFVYGKFILKEIEYNLSPFKN